jgi:hypothetical protein
MLFIFQCINWSGFHTAIGKFENRTLNKKNIQYKSTQTTM